jgi:hypothetical protein
MHRFAYRLILGEKPITISPHARRARTNKN